MCSCTYSNLLAKPITKKLAKTILSKNLFFVGILKATEKKAGSVPQWYEFTDPDP